jgi:RTX calcium-binding nonapeptide repeat (4 copies)
VDIKLILLIMTLLYIFQLSAFPNALAIGDAFMMNSQTISSLVQKAPNKISSLSSDTNLITCSPPIPPNIGICNGTNQNDVIIGSVLQDTINGLDGDDRIQGSYLADVIFGGNGNDIISGGEGTDTLFGEDGNDVLIGDSGTNVIFGGGGNFLYGGNGDDHLLGGSDNDVLTGGPGKDFFDCNEGADTVADFNPNEDTANNNCEILKSI